MGLSEATKEGIFIRNILREVLGQDNIIKLYNDNQSAQKLAQNPVFHNCSKHRCVTSFCKRGCEK